MRIITSYSRQEVYDEIVWLLAHDATDEVLRQVWQLVRPNAVVVPPPADDSEPFSIEQDMIDSIERPRRHENGH